MVLGARTLGRHPGKKKALEEKSLLPTRLNKDTPGQREVPTGQLEPPHTASRNWECHTLDNPTPTGDLERLSWTMGGCFILSWVE